MPSTLIKLPANHIKVGAFIWYSGRTSIGSWDCPAVITRVNSRKRTFRVRSLDDMLEQTQVYDFDISEHTPDSRLTMRPIDPSIAVNYMRSMGEQLANEHASLEQQIEEKAKALAKFRRFQAKLTA